MSIFETFSKRKKKLEQAGKDDVYQYDDFPQAFRVQVIHIWRSAIGPCKGIHGGLTYDTPAYRLWQEIHNLLAREKGQFFLGDAYDEPDKQCQTLLIALSKC